MPKCEHCGFGHAQKDRCVNCGSTDPFPRRRRLKLVVWLVILSVFAASGFYFYERAKELKLAEERVKAVGDRVYGVRRAGSGAVSGDESPRP